MSGELDLRAIIKTISENSFGVLTPKRICEEITIPQLVALYLDGPEERDPFALRAGEHRMRRGGMHGTPATEPRE